MSMKEVIVGLLFLILIIVLCAYAEKVDEETVLRSEPIVTNWLSEKTFEVVSSVERVDDLEMGRVIVRRVEDDILFSVMVIPIREISVGSTVKIVEVRYKHHILIQKNFMMVR